MLSLIAVILLSAGVDSVGAYSGWSSSYSSYNNYDSYDSRSRQRKYSDAYNDFYGALPFMVCDDSVVELEQIFVLCDSPYTFYYGNGANRNSPTCNYGDKATVSGTVNVVDDLQYGDEIYITVAVSDDRGNVLVGAGPTNFCTEYVGYKCVRKGEYSFQHTMKLGSTDTLNTTHFYPFVQMAFSSKPDAGYNLGAVNVKCKKWDERNPSTLDWAADPSSTSWIDRVAKNYGMLLVTGILVFGFSLFVWSKAGEDDGIDHLGSNKREGLLAI